MVCHRVRVATKVRLIAQLEHSRTSEERGQVTDVQRAIDDARQAREQAETAARRAEELEAQVEAARARAEQLREARRREWAQRTVDAYESDLSAAETAIQEAQQRFEAVATSDLAAALSAYLAWGEAASRHYATQVRIGVAAPLVDYEVSPPESIELPPFSAAIDDALRRRLAELSDQARDTMAAELQKIVTEQPA